MKATVTESYIVALEPENDADSALLELWSTMKAGILSSSRNSDGTMEAMFIPFSMYSVEPLLNGEDEQPKSSDGKVYGIWLVDDGGDGCWVNDERGNTHNSPNRNAMVAQMRDDAWGDGKLSVEIIGDDGLPVELITTPCPGTCVTPCGSPDCNTKLINQIQPHPSIQCPHCAHWMMETEGLGVLFSVDFVWAPVVVCQRCHKSVRITRRWQPEYLVEKVE